MEHRIAAGVKAGDQVEVIVERGLEPQTIDVPDDLAAALVEKPDVTAAFDALSYSRRKEYLCQVEAAKAEATRHRQIAGIAAKLTEGSE